MILIPYNPQPTFMDELEIDNEGEFALEINNDEQMFWYYVVRTTLGQTSIAKAGPKIPDIDLLPKSYSQERFVIAYNEGKIMKDVMSFVNDPKKKITQARVVDIDFAIEQFVNLKDYLENYSEDLN